MGVAKLIILRGPSGSGKTTVAKRLFSGTSRKTVLIEQDHYRFIFKPEGLSEAGKEMIFSDVAIALKNGYDVILDGILPMSSYGKYFDNLWQEYPRENYMFYFDISFAETLKRHATKPNADEFGEKEMKKWYKPKDYSGYEWEVIIPESSSIEETMQLIKQTSGV